MGNHMKCARCSQESVYRIIVTSSDKHDADDIDQIVKTKTIFERPYGHRYSYISYYCPAHLPVINTQVPDDWQVLIDNCVYTK
jgi:hypothetical protein